MADYVANVYRQLSCTNHSDGIRDKHDYYATDPVAVERFLKTLEEEGIALDNMLWECATGENHIKDVLSYNGYNVVGSDIVERSVVVDNVIDFLKVEKNPYPYRSIITNPPYRKALEFTRKALDLVENGKQVIMFMKIQFLEGKSRYELYKEHPPKYVFIHSSRVNCAKGGEFDKYTSSAVCYAWFMWEKGYTGETSIKWIK